MAMNIKNFNNKVTKNGIGTGLLNANAAAATMIEEYPKILLSQIVPNPYNAKLYEKEITREDVKDLMESIKEVGLQQPLVGYQMNSGKYMLTTGHRRYYACKFLYDEGYGKVNTIPIKIVELDNINLPLSNDLKEQYLLVTTNSEVRNKTDEMKIREFEILSQVYDELKKAGLRPEGRKREWLASNMNVSNGTMAKMQIVNKKAAPEIWEGLKAGDIKLEDALRVSSAPMETQPEVAEVIKRRQEEENPATPIEVEAIVEGASLEHEAKKEASIAPIDRYNPDEIVKIPDKEFDVLIDYLGNLSEMLKRSQGQETTKVKLLWMRKRSTELLQKLSSLDIMGDMN